MLKFSYDPGSILNKNRLYIRLMNKLTDNNIDGDSTNNGDDIKKNLLAYQKRFVSSTNKSSGELNA